MPLFDRYFKPYADYCLPTVFSEADLKAAFEKKFASYNFRSGFKAASDETGIVFFRTSRPLVLRPVLSGRNSLRGKITIRCKKTDGSGGNVLHIVITPPNWSLFPWIVFCFSVMSAVLLICAGMWQAVYPLGMTVFLFVFLAIGRSMAEKEIPAIRREFECTLRLLEKNPEMN